MTFWAKAGNNQLNNIEGLLRGNISKGKAIETFMLATVMPVLVQQTASMLASAIKELATGDDEEDKDLGEYAVDVLAGVAGNVVQPIPVIRSVPSLAKYGWSSMFPPALSVPGRAGETVARELFKEGDEVNAWKIMTSIMRLSDVGTKVPITNIVKNGEKVADLMFNEEE